MPRARGGPDTIDNLVRACRSCNSSKGDTPMVQWTREHDIEPSRHLRGKYFKLLYETHATRDARHEPRHRPKAHPRTPPLLPWIEPIAFPFSANR